MYKIKKISIRRKHLYVAVALLFLVSGATVFYPALHSSAAGSGTFTLSPASGTESLNSTFTVTLSEDSGSDPVNAVQASMTYSSSNLQFMSVDYTTSPFDVQAASSGGSGTVAISRGTTTSGGLTGNQVVGVITFKVIAGGSGTVGFGCVLDNSTCPDGNALVESSDAANIISSGSDMTGASYTLVDNTPPTTSISAPTTGSSVSGSNTTITASATDNSGSGLASLVFKLGGAAISGTGCSVTSPTSGTNYNCSWDTTGVSNGSHSLTVTATDNNSDTTTSTAVTVTVNNSGPTVSLVATPTSIKAGGSSTLTWTSTNSPTSCTASGAWSGSKATSNTVGTTVSPSATSIYTLTCTGLSGTSSPSSATVTVVGLPTVSITAPTSGATVSGTATISTHATAATGATIHDVQFQADGTNISGCDPTSPASGTNTNGTYSCTTWDTSGLNNASHTIKAIVTDTVSQTANATESVTVHNTCTAPSTPTSVAATGNTFTTISLGWNASTANSPCTMGGYYVYRNGTQVGTVTSGTSYTDTGLTASRTYAYTVQAYDSGADTSAQSTAANLSTVADSEAPTAPSNLRLTLDGASQVDVSWTASSENPNLGGVAISSYKIYRCEGDSCTVNTAGSPVGTTSDGSTTSYADTSVVNTAATAYNYEVVGYAVNNSPDSTAAAITTLACTTASGTTTCTNPGGSDLSGTNAIVTNNELLTNDGTLCNTTIQSGATLKGDGNFGEGATGCSLNVATGGIVSPGHSPGCVTVNGDYTQTGTYQAEIQSPGNTACTDYDQIVVTGTGHITLTNGSLDPELLSSFSPAVGQSFTVLSNQTGNSITGTYQGLPESAVFAVGNTKFRISYKGGTSNQDVVLTTVDPSTPVTASLTGNVTAPKAPDTGLGILTSRPLVVFGIDAGSAGLLWLASRRKLFE